MFEQYTSVYLAPSVFTNADNFFNFLSTYTDEIVKDNKKLSIAPETRLFVDSMTREGLISQLVKHQLNNYKVFKVCLDVQCYSLRECLVEDTKNGKILVVIGENAYPDLYVGITYGVDIAEINKAGKLVRHESMDLTTPEMLLTEVEPAIPNEQLEDVKQAIASIEAALVSLKKSIGLS